MKHLTAVVSLSSPERQLMAYAAIQPEYKLGQSPKMQELYLTLDGLMTLRFANIFIRGEPGTESELVARMMHSLDANRKNRPFIYLDCAKVTSQIESFNGAEDTTVKYISGLIDLARGGTLFFDRIDEIPASPQHLVYMTLKQRQGVEGTPRIVSSTSENLDALISAERFTHELYERTTPFSVSVSPLRERPEDIGQLAAYANKLFSPVPKTTALTPDGVAYLQSLRWPGNFWQFARFMHEAVNKGQPMDAAYLEKVPAGDYSGRNHGGQAMHNASAALGASRHELRPAHTGTLTSGGRVSGTAEPEPAQKVYSARLEERAKREAALIRGYKNTIGLLNAEITQLRAGAGERASIECSLSLDSESYAASQYARIERRGIRLDDATGDLESTIINIAIEKAQGNLANAAGLLGISKTNLGIRMRILRIPVSNDRRSAAEGTSGGIMGRLQALGYTEDAVSPSGMHYASLSQEIAAESFYEKEGTLPEIALHIIRAMAVIHNYDITTTAAVLAVSRKNLLNWINGPTIPYRVSVTPMPKAYTAKDLPRISRDSFLARYRLNETLAAVVSHRKNNLGGDIDAVAKSLGTTKKVLLNNFSLAF